MANHVYVNYKESPFEGASLIHLKTCKYCGILEPLIPYGGGCTGGQNPQYIAEKHSEFFYPKHGITFPKKVFFFQISNTAHKAWEQFRVLEKYYAS